jgi:hypothetical protein
VVVGRSCLCRKLENQAPLLRDHLTTKQSRKASCVVVVVIIERPRIPETRWLSVTYDPDVTDVATVNTPTKTHETALLWDRYRKAWL